MNASTHIASLISQHASVSIKERATDYPTLLIDNAAGSAEIALHGAHVMRFKPTDALDALWLSKTAVYKKGKAIRGGIPICWPWFGDHPTNSSLPAHGFVRNRFWHLDAIEEPSDSETRLTFSTQQDTASLALWPFHFNLELSVTVSSELTVELKMRNTDTRTMRCGGALHSYFSVGDIDKTYIESVKGLSYLDKPSGFTLNQQEATLVFQGEVDRVFTNIVDGCEITDSCQQRTIHVDKSGSETTVIWNPWADIAASMSDMPDDGYKHFVCVEPANAFEDVVDLEPGQSHILSTTIRLSD